MCLFARGWSWRWAVAAVCLSPIPDSTSWLPSGKNCIVINNEFLLSAAHNPKTLSFGKIFPVVCFSTSWKSPTTLQKVTLCTFLLAWAWDSGTKDAVWTFHRCNLIKFPPPSPLGASEHHDNGLCSLVHFSSKVDQSDPKKMWDDREAISAGSFTPLPREVQLCTGNQQSSR